MIVGSHIDGRLKIYDEAFSSERIKELETECANLKFTFGAYDNVENPVPTGMACEGITNTATFKFLWEFCEKNCPEVNKLALWKSSCNFFAPNENALYHDDDDSPGAITLIYYANTFWDINDGGETKMFTDASKMIYAVAPIPGRIITFPSNMLHTATGFRHKQRFTPALKFVTEETLKRRQTNIKEEGLGPHDSGEGLQQNKIRIING